MKSCANWSAKVCRDAGVVEAAPLPVDAADPVLDPAEVTPVMGLDVPPAVVVVVPVEESADVDVPDMPVVPVVDVVSVELPVAPVDVVAPVVLGVPVVPVADAVSVELPVAPVDVVAPVVLDVLEVVGSGDVDEAPVV